MTVREQLHVVLEDVLTPNYDWIVLDPDADYKQVTVKLWGKGIVQRAIVKGSDIAAASQLRVKAGQFIVSRIDARHGAFGFIPPQLNGAVVSSDFPCFDVDKTRLNVRYLAWLSRTPEFVDLARSGSEGSTNRVRLKEARFLKQKLILPLLAEQEAIAKQLDKAASYIEKRAKAAQSVSDNLQAMLQVVFRRITRSAPVVCLGEIAPLVRRNVKIEEEKSYTEIGIRSFYRGTFRRRTIPGSSFTWQELFSIKEHDLIFSNLMAWEGAVAIATRSDVECVGNRRMLTCEVNLKRAVPSFIHFYFTQPEGSARLIAASPSSIARNRTLGPVALHNLPVPLPSLGAQQIFDSLHTKVQAALAAHNKVEEELANLLPALLHQTFNDHEVALPNKKATRRRAAA
ncbi:restriction endonuclease subunit S [Lichenicola cladoniae]|uniref:Restriction endonuclease subunit S n=1 Tax=Lichenicola cladoniae TaxID=1484109 RepID=A0A6M8HNY4_9PROT|nr:restriction endonuclease subunit S [Lichenicola cladoniae]NPD68398.1 restriction endonuclease subunit S [Acetobacteraceae bacterium]QKE90114.1 restriction endonuclease subunit S [Lichenicola cladoniae]